MATRNTAHKGNEATYRVSLPDVDLATAEMLCQFLRKINCGSMTQDGKMLMEHLKAKTGNRVGEDSFLIQFNADGEPRPLMTSYSAQYIAEVEGDDDINNAIKELLEVRKEDGEYRAN